MSWSHFERMASDYAAARPPYPPAVFELLQSEGVIGPGLHVLEVGAGAGLATRELVGRGSRVVAIEPGPDLGAILTDTVPGVQVLRAGLEDASLPLGEFDSAVAATSLHWVDLSVGLSKLHGTLRRDGRLAVFRNIFGDDSIRTEFRERVGQITARREQEPERTPPEPRPTLADLCRGAFFQPLRSEHWRWSIDLTTDQVGRLFSTFSDWNSHEVEAIRGAADDCGGTVTEHYQTVLHLLARA